MTTVSVEASAASFVGALTEVCKCAESPNPGKIFSIVMPGKRAAKTATAAVCGASRAYALRPGFCESPGLNTAAAGKTENTSGSPKRRSMKINRQKQTIPLHRPEPEASTASFFLVHLIFLFGRICHEDIKQTEACQRSHSNANNKRYHSNFPFCKKAHRCFIQAAKKQSLSTFRRVHPSGNTLKADCSKLIHIAAFDIHRRMNIPLQSDLGAAVTQNLAKGFDLKIHLDTAGGEGMAQGVKMHPF